METMKQCRICLEEGSEYEFMAPCNCKGSIEHIHPVCLDKEVESRDSLSCSVCNGSYHHILYKTLLGIVTYTAVLMYVQDILLSVCLLSPFMFAVIMLLCYQKQQYAKLLERSVKVLLIVNFGILVLGIKMPILLKWLIFTACLEAGMFYKFYKTNFPLLVISFVYVMYGVLIVSHIDTVDLSMPAMTILSSVFSVMLLMNVYSE